MRFDLAASLAAANRQHARGCVKIEEDLIRYERIIAASRPDGIIECFPAEQLVVGAETAVRALRRPYRGPLVQIATTSGDMLTATPNHEVLTRNGWRPAGTIREGDDLVSSTFLKRMGGGDPYVDHMPTPIGEVFDAWQPERRQRRLLEGMYFDRHYAHGEVEVVAAGRYLRADIHAALGQPASHGLLAFAHLRPGPLPGRGARNQRRLGHPTPTYSCMGSRLHPGVPIGIPLESQQRGLTARAWNVTGPAESRPQSRPRHAVLGAESNHRFPGDVPTHRVLSCRSFPYDGHVYNLQTETGVYGAGGIIVHNCGTFSGKSALFFAETAGAPVFTIDVHAQVDPATQEQWYANRVTGHVGSSLSPHTAWAVREWLKRAQVTRPMIVLDGDHSADTVLDEMRLYGRLVQAGGYMVAEDTLVRWMPHEQVDHGGPYRGSPMDAVEQFLAANTAWELDVDTDRLFSIGQYPGGWLRRVG